MTVILTAASNQDLLDLLTASTSDPIAIQSSIGGVIGKSVSISRSEIQKIAIVPTPAIPRMVPIGTAVVNTSANIRVAPAGALIKTLPMNTQVTVLSAPLVNAAITGTTAVYTWTNIRLADGVQGWIVEKYLNPALSGTRKVGAHLMGTLSESELRGAIALGASVYKVVDNVGYAQRIHADLPSATIIFRRYKPDGYWLNMSKSQGEGYAVNAYMQERASDLASLPYAYHESDNEVGCPPEYASFEALRARTMARYGYKACLINIQTANTSAAMWNTAKDVLVACEEGGHLIGVHGYAQTIMSNNYGTSYAGADGKWNGELFPTTPSKEAWTALKVLRDITDVESLGFYRAQFAVTESGLDDLVQNGNGVHYINGVKTRGWKSCINVWKSMGWTTTISPEEFYRNQLSWYDSILRTNSRITGAVVFSHGSDDAQWADFDTRSVFL